MGSPITPYSIEAFSESIRETLEQSQTNAAEIQQNEAATSDEKAVALAEENIEKGAHILKLSLKSKEKPKIEEVKEVEEPVVARKENPDALANEFAQRQANRAYRLDPRLLSALLTGDLGAGIKEDSSLDDIIATVRKRLTVNGQQPDVAMIDKALEFLLETTSAQLEGSTGGDQERLTKIVHNIETAKNKHFEDHTVKISVAHKIIGAADAGATATGQPLQETLDRYREIVHNPPELQTLRKFFETKGFRFMILELKGLSSFLGASYKQGNLERAELWPLVDATQKMQALLGVFRQAKLHLSVMESYLQLNTVLG